MNLAGFSATCPQHRMKKPSPLSGGTIWPDFSRKYSRVARPSVTLTARLPVCSQGLMFSSFPATWLGSHSLQKHLFCQQSQDPGRLIFPGQWRATSLKGHTIFSAWWLRPQPPQALRCLTFPWLQKSHFPQQRGLRGRVLKPSPGLRGQAQLPKLPQATRT